MRSSPEYVREVLSPFFPEHSEAAKYWDSLSPELRGVVLHAASVHSGDVLTASLAKCNWGELYARLDYRRMMSLRSGIIRARSLFAGFGSLRDRDFAPHTARSSNIRPQPEVCHPASTLPVQTAALVEGRNQLRQQIQGGKA